MTHISTHQNLGDHLKRPPLHVAVIQYRGSNEHHEEARDSLLSSIELAGQSDVQLVVAPECAPTDYLFVDAAEARLYSDTVDGAFARALTALAVRYGIWCVVGIVEREETHQEAHEESSLYNSALIVKPSGERLCYRKRLLFDADERWAQSGDLYPSAPLSRGDLAREELDLGEDPDAPYPLLDVFGWRATVGICMDLNDTRFVDFCERAQVNLIAFPTNWLDEGYDVIPYWAYRLQSVPDAYLLAANSHGTEKDTTFCGTSSILYTDPPTLWGSAPNVGDYMISAILD